MVTKSQKVTVAGQKSWSLKSSTVEAFVTEQGGHLGPVTFDREGRQIQPLHVAPWAEETFDDSIPPVLKVLRGDFFCMPFGGNVTAYRGENHPAHGETANEKWQLESLQEESGKTILHLSLTPQVRVARVDKHITLMDGHNAVYSRHIVSGMAGRMNLGHHAMLRFHDEPGSGVISTSRFVHGQVFTQPVERPENRGYSLLKPAATFETLQSVATITGENTDLSRYPARRGYEDLVQLVNDPSLPFAWTAVTFPTQRYVWFALKDPHVLSSTILWFSNGGRHFAPWSGRHINVMGLEEVTSYFHEGLSASARPNPFTDKGFQTYLTLHPKRPLVANSIMAVASIPRGFDRVQEIELSAGGVRLISNSGHRVEVPLYHEFLHEEIGN